MPSIVHVHFGPSGRQFLIAEATTAQLSYVKPVPPQAFFVGSAIFHYLGPSFAVLLFARVDVLGVAWLRIASAALVFALWRRPWRRFAALDRNGQLLIVALGAVFAFMNACFYISIDRLPLATVAAIEFIGPIALALIAARTSRNLAAVLAAALGVYLLTHVRFGGQELGVAFAFANAALFTAYIVLAHRVSRRSAMGGVDGLAAAMMFAFVFVSPIGFADAAHALGDPVAIAAGIGVGVWNRARDGRRRPPPPGGLMDQIRLGASGLHVSRLGLGMMSYGNDANRPWMLDEAAAEPIVRRAIEGGFTFFDTADMYSQGGSEVATGRLLRKLLSRDELVVATKVYFPMTPGPNGRGLSRKHILSAIDASLQRLELDYVDLYQIHRWDSETPIEETMEALHDVVRSGKARYIGASSMYAWQFAKAQRVAERNSWTPFVSMQNHYNLIYREEEREMIPQCIDQGVGIIPWSPLARGFLAGTRTREGERRTRRSETDPLQDEWYGRPEDFDVVDRLNEVAGERGVPPAQVALAWLLHKPGVTAPIVGATKLGHLEDALAAAELELSPDEIARLEEPYRPHRVLGHGG